MKQAYTGQQCNEQQTEQRDRKTVRQSPQLQIGGLRSTEQRASPVCAVKYTLLALLARHIDRAQVVAACLNQSVRIALRMLASKLQRQCRALGDSRQAVKLAKASAKRSVCMASANGSQRECLVQWYFLAPRITLGLHTDTLALVSLQQFSQARQRC